MIALLFPTTAAVAAIATTATTNGRAGRHESRRQPALPNSQKLPVHHTVECEAICTVGPEHCGGLS